MLIIAGYVTVIPDQRAAYVADCVQVVEAARSSAGCLDFSISADSAEPGRVLIYERWATDEQLVAFRGAGPSDGQQATILTADASDTRSRPSATREPPDDRAARPPSR